MYSIGKRILLRRTELGMSQEELAKKVGYADRSSIAKIESGERDIRQKKVVAFAEALKTTPQWLMGYDEPDPDGTPPDAPIPSSDATLSRAERIAEAIKKKGLSYAELEKLTGVSSSALQRYATGQTKKIPVDVIEAIAAATGVGARYLMDRGEGARTISIDFGSAGSRIEFDAPNDESIEYLRNTLGHLRDEIVAGKVIKITPDNVQGEKGDDKLIAKLHKAECDQLLDSLSDDSMKKLKDYAEMLILQQSRAESKDG